MQNRNIITAVLVITFVSFLTISLEVLAAPGDLDSSFNGTGIVTTIFGSGTDENPGIAVQADGKIVVVGFSYNGTNFDFAIARYNLDGTLDTSFDMDGKLTTDFGINSSDYASDVAIQTDGKIVAVGQGGPIPGHGFAVARYNPDGSLDTSFNGTGRVVTPIFGEAKGVVIQPDGKIVIAGDGFTIIRYSPNGSLDTSFDGDGIVTTVLDGLTYGANDVALQSNGRIVAAGNIRIGEDNEAFAVVRYNIDGSLDTSFDIDGKVTTNFGEFYDVAQGVTLQSDGKIIAAGYSETTTPEGTVFALARYQTNGSLDPTYDGDGKVTTPVGVNSGAIGVTIQPNQKIVAVGGSFNGSTVESAIVRYNTDASLDTSFGSGGKALTLVGERSQFYGVAVQPDGKIVTGGVTRSPVADFLVCRYLGDPVVSRQVSFDFDGDSKTDIGIFRPNGSASEWWINRSGNGQTFALQFGTSTDLIAPADYTGDGKTDIAFFRPASGEWYVLRSEDFSFFALPFGTAGDVPVPADYDADAKADFAVFRPSFSTWFISQSSGAPMRIEQFGVSGDLPVVADYDADGKADVAIFRPAASGAQWWVSRSTSGSLAMQFGASTDKPVQGDYTGDGKVDIAVWRPSDGNWLIVRSEDFSFFGFPFGANGDVPSPGDYDGDGKFDATVFRPVSATWFVARSTAGTQIVQFGATGDRPIPNAFVP
jgi:uncharacterized delta-60 repeat protein